MYIRYKNQIYPCRCIITNQSITYTKLPENFPNSVTGTITLCANDGFEMRIDNAQNYLRQTFENGTLTLTNVPESEPEQVSEQNVDEIEQLRADIDYIAIMTGVEL